MRESLHPVAILALPLSVVVTLVIAISSNAVVQWPENSEPFHINPPGEISSYLTYGLGSLWMTDSASGKIWRLNPSTGSVQDSLESNWGGGIAFDGQYLWKALYSAPTIRRIQPSDGATVTEIPGVGSQQAGLAWDGTTLWIADQSTQRIYQLDPNTGAQLNSFDSPGPYPRGLAWWNGYLYHADSFEDTIYQLDPCSGAVISRMRAPAHSSTLRGLAFDGTYMWYSESGLGIDRLVTDVSGDGRVIRSNPSLMVVEERYQITNTGATAGEDLEAYWSVPMADDAHEIVELIYDPLPDDYIYDMFGQKIAHFESFPTLMPGETEEIILRAYLEIWRKNHRVEPDQVGALTDIPEEITDLYLADADFLQITDPDILAAAESAIGDESNPYLMAIGIHDYVRDHMVYDMGSGTAYDALSILHAGCGVCEHYATLFVSLGRSVGLPTRIVKHFHYYEETESCGGHVWADAYIPGYGWIPFDPTRDDYVPPRERYVACEPLGIINFRNGGTDDRYVSRWGRGWVTRGMENERELLHVGLLPLGISNFSAITGSSPCSIQLDWTNPLAPDLDTVLVKRKTGAYPASRNDGVTVYEDTSPTPETPAAFTDESLTPGATYYYAVFTQSATGIWRSTVEEGVNADHAVASPTEVTSAVFRADSSGDVFGDGTFYADRFFLGSADIAEWIQVTTPVGPGDVVSLNPTHPGSYQLAAGSCSVRVAGVISSQPGVALGSSLCCAENALLALAGIVPVKVTNEGGPIRPGDLLVSSSTPGHAMRWSGPDPCPCSLVGKALEPMTENEGLVLVLLTAH